MGQKKTNQARHLRQDQTRSENLLWSRLRNRQLEGWKFRRQVPRGPYIVDFFCAETGLVIELEGGIHRLRPEEDKARALDLERQGYRVLKIQNQDLFNDVEGVLTEILRHLSPPSP